MSFKAAKKAVAIFIIASFVLCVTGLVAFPQESRGLSICASGAVIILLFGVAIAIKWCRCPYCGQLIFRGLYSRKICPNCNRDLITGKKQKGKGGKK